MDFRCLRPYNFLEHQIQTVCKSDWFCPYSDNWTRMHIRELINIIRVYWRIPSLVVSERRLKRRFIRVLLLDRFGGTCTKTCRMRYENAHCLRLTINKCNTRWAHFDALMTVLINRAISIDGIPNRHLLSTAKSLYIVLRLTDSVDLWNETVNLIRRCARSCARLQPMVTFWWIITETLNACSDHDGSRT